MFELKNKVALVTGAGQGMGKSHAITLANQGAKVIVTDINKDKCDLVAKEIKENNQEAVTFKMDVSDKKEVNEVFDKVIEKYGRLDILINNAGIYFNKPALELTEEDWDKMININLKGQFICAQRAAEEMAKNKWGRIINISSVASGQTGIGNLGAAHYTASKGGIIGLSETLAIEWAKLGINVNVIAPGAIDTPMGNSDQLSKKQKNSILQKIPLDRMGEPEEVSAMVVFLASEESSYVTGSTFYVDGGWLAS